MKIILRLVAPVIFAAIATSCVSSDVLETAASTSTATTETEEAFGIPEPRPESSVNSATLTSPGTPPADLPGISDETFPTIADTPPVAVEQQALKSDITIAPSTSQPASDVLAMVDPNAPLQPTLQQPFEGAIDGLQPAEIKGPAKTYLINGLLSAVPFIGYGFRNLNKKMPEAKLYSYMGVVEGPAAIAPAVIKDAEAAWRVDPTTRINLVGISLGADLITVIAEKLHAKGVPVAYLGIVDGTNLRPIPNNVKIADNLTCSYLDCTKARARLAKGNTTTQFTRKVYKSSHIPLGDNDELHAHVIARSR